MNVSSWKLLAALLIADAAVFLSHIFLRGTLGFFHFEKEGNLGSIQAGIKFWLAAVAAWISAWIIYKTRKAHARILSYTLLCAGIGLAYIGLDNMMALHERIGFVINNILGTGGFYGESFNWLLYFSPFVVLALGTFSLILFHVKRIDPTVFYTFLAAVLLCLASVGAEWLGGNMITSPNLNVERYRQLILIEEGLEMVGASLFVTALYTLTSRLMKAHIRVEA